MQTEVYVTDVSVLNNDSVFEKFFLSMPKYRQEKILKFKPRESKNLSLGVGILLSYALRKNCFDENKLILKINVNGKPYYENNPVFFSLSHSGNYACCAISNKPIGIDIEMNRDINLQIAERFFSDYDKKKINESENKENCFLKIWTEKESYAKFCGLALSDVLEKDIEESNFSIFQNKDYLITLCTEDKFDSNLQELNLEVLDV